MIKLIISDFTGVVAFGGHKKLCRQLAEKYNLDFNHVYDIVYNTYWEPFALNKISEKESFQGVIDELGFDFTWQEMVDMYLKTHVINQEMVDYIKELRHDYKVILLTKNIKRYLDWERKEFGLDDLFDDIINTSEINLPKASEATLHYVLERHPVEPHEVIYIDDQEDNLVDAKNIGIHTVLYKYFNQVKKDFDHILNA